MRLHLTGLGRFWRSLVWFVRELAGETAYDRYLARCRLAEAQGCSRPLTAAEFWRARGDQEPPPRCC
ncbi:MAG: YbdD/YjiX family protein [Propionibacteriaceae bacterium]|nr:YbdD/YjiX family protein [Propionibacteriaceae bacterium]